MDRRKFICRITATTAGAAAVSKLAGAAPRPKETRKITYKVKGFTCITCAVGLEVMLRGFKGVTQADASYPSKNVVIGYDEHLTNEKALKEFITVCGFSVA